LNASALLCFVALIFRESMREDALEWVKEQEKRRERHERLILAATIAAAVGA
jgi:hypothetical protein